MVTSSPSGMGGYQSPRYGALRTISGIYRILAYVVIVVTILASLGVGVSMLSQRGALVGLVGAVGALAYGAIIALSLMAFAEGISVFLDIEQNTRTNNELLGQLLRPTASNAATQYSVPNQPAQY